MWNWIEKIAELNASGKAFAVVTVVETTGSTPREVGAKMALTDLEFFGTIGGGHLEQLALTEARECLRSDTSKKIRYPLGAKTGQCCGGVVEVLVESVNTGPHLYLFGAGHVGQAISKTLVGTPFKVHVIDEREEWIHHSELPKSVVRHACEWEDFVAEAVWDASRTHVAIMTHRHDRDEAILADLLKRETRYLGLIGSRSKWTRFQQRLTARGVEPKLLERVKCPIGLIPTGKAPQEIAISFAAELLQVYHVA